jgi:hypothetical protein
MKQRVFTGFLLTLFWICCFGQHAHKVAIFAPLYLDSAFDAAGNYHFEKSFPKYLNPGLEFYEGAQFALDSLDSRKAPLEVYVYDTRSREPLATKLNRPELKNVELFVAETNAAEARILAETARERKIPFISTNVPNDLGITNNPYFVILNSTLPTHVEGIYRFLQKYNSLDPIVVFRKPGAQEDQIKSDLIEAGRTTLSRPLTIRYVDLSPGFTASQLLPYLDSTRKTICICGSLEEGFGNRLLQELGSVSHTYPITVMGMPTWDNFNFSRTETGAMEVIYTTPFYYNRATSLESELANAFTSNIGSRPTEMFFRGYESTLHFILLVLAGRNDLASDITRKGFNVFTPFDIQPVFKDKKTMTLDYFENKHLYFIHVLRGVKNVLY